MTNKIGYTLLATLIAMLICSFTLFVGAASVLIYAIFGTKGYIIAVAIIAVISAVLGVKFAQMLSRSEGDKHEN